MYTYEDLIDVNTVALEYAFTEAEGKPVEAILEDARKIRKFILEPFNIEDEGEDEAEEGAEIFIIKRNPR